MLVDWLLLSPSSFGNLFPTFSTTLLSAIRRREKMYTREKIKFAIPRNMASMVRNHLICADLEVEINEGLFRGEIRNWEIAGRPVLIGLPRSLDIPPRVAWRKYDFALVGEDCVQEQELRYRIEVERIASFPYGRRTCGSSPKLVIVADANEEIKRLEDIPPGTLISSDFPWLTRKFLEGRGLKPRFITSYDMDVDERREQLRRNRAVGIEVIHGAALTEVSLDQDIGVVVDETGETVNSNGVLRIATIMDVPTVLIANTAVFRDDPRVRAAIKELAARLKSALPCLKERISERVAT